MVSLSLNGPNEVKVSGGSRVVNKALLEIERHGLKARGEVGVAAWRLNGRGPKLLLNAEHPFPMASTFKVAVACRIMEQIDAGELRIGEVIEIPEHMRVPSSVVSERFMHPGISLSIHNLLQVMLDESDNTATDVLNSLAGGASAVTAALRRWGIAGQRVDRDTRGQLRDFYGLEDGPFIAKMQEIQGRPNHAQDRRFPNPVFEGDSRDVSTPWAMNSLLTQLFSGQLLSAESTLILENIMHACRTGAARIRGLLPSDIPVASKSGTIGGVVNDVGMITLPNNAGRVVLSIFIKMSEAPFEHRERAIAEIARTAYDFYLLDEEDLVPLGP